MIFLFFIMCTIRYIVFLQNIGQGKTIIIIINDNVVFDTQIPWLWSHTRSAGQKGTKTTKPSRPPKESLSFFLKLSPPYIVCMWQSVSSSFSLCSAFPVEPLRAHLAKNTLLLQLAFVWPCFGLEDYL